MAIYTSINPMMEDAENKGHTHEYDEEFDETEGDLIENYLYLTQHCGALRHSPTTNALDAIQQRRANHPPILPRQSSWATEYSREECERSFRSSKHHLSMDDFNNNYQPDYSTTSRIPPTIYYNTSENDDYDDRPFSLVKIVARMKGRLKHDRRYRPDSTHELLREEDSQDWLELTKNTRQILSKALLPDGGYDAIVFNYRTSQNRRNSQKKMGDSEPVLLKHMEDDNDQVFFVIDETLGTENDEDVDEIIWKKFLNCTRGFSYRRSGVCKAVDRQQFQGQLVYVYGVANNIIIDENLKASGLG